MTPKLPPLPSTPWVLHMDAQECEPEWTSTYDGYKDDDMHAYGLACWRQGMEDAAGICEAESRLGVDDERAHNGRLMADAIRKEIITP